MVHVANENTGEEVLTFVPQKEFNTIVFSSMKVEFGETYQVFVGRTIAEDAIVMDGLVSAAGNYTLGTEDGSFTVSSMMVGEWS